MASWENATYALAGALTDELARSGLKVVVVCPGSRSAPLALAFWRERRIRVLMHVDERSAAYLALGIGRASGRPAAVLGTSGTAVANFLPAVEEARYGHVPLLVLTADRPPELRDTGALQTIDQVHLYGRSVKWFAELPVPEVREDVFRRVRFLTDRAYAETLGSPSAPAGPVHLNVPLREPLVPEPVPGERVPTTEEQSSEAFAGRRDGRPFVTLTSPGCFGTGVVRREDAGSRSGFATEGASPDAAGLSDVADLFREGRRGLILLGPLDPEDLVHESGQMGPGRVTSAVLDLAQALGWPVLADPLSGARTEALPESARELVLCGYDAVVRALAGPQGAALGERLRPDVAIVFGAVAVSKATQAWLSACPARLKIVRGGPRDLIDPEQTADRVLLGDPAAIATRLFQLAGRVRGRDAPIGAGPDRAFGTPPDRAPVSRSAWLRNWQTADRLAQETLREGLRERTAVGALFEGQVAAELAAKLPSGSTLFVGNSMPIRDVDSFVAPSLGASEGVRILANRGVSGIDGVVSSAFGAAQASGEEAGPTALLIGDLSFLHDANGLLAARLSGLSLLVVLVENDGGGIFSFLPQARLEDSLFEPLFGVPLGLDVRPLVEMMGGSFTRVRTLDELDAALARDIERPGLRVIASVAWSRRENVRLHEALWQRVAERLVMFFGSPGSPGSFDAAEDRLPNPVTPGPGVSPR